MIIAVACSTTLSAQSTAGSYVNQPADPNAPVPPKGFSSPVKGDPSIDTTKDQVHDLRDQDDPDAPHAAKKKRKFNFTSTTIPSTNGTNGSNTAPGR